MDISRLFDEKVLLREIADGDERAFRRLFDAYKDRFYAVTLKMIGSPSVAEDIVQELFITIWMKRGRLKDIDNPSSYFFTMVYRRVYRYYQKLALDRNLLHAVESECKTSSNETQQRITMRETDRLISSAVSKLPPQQKQVFILSRQSGLTREDIAIKLQISPNTVRNHLTSAIRFIKSFLESAGATAILIFLNDII